MPPAKALIAVAAERSGAAALDRSQYFELRRRQ